MDKWLKQGKLNIQQPSKLCLPDPRAIEDTEKAQSYSSANANVSKEMDSTNGTPSKSSRKRKRPESYGQYSPETRLKIARYCIDNGPAKTSRHFSDILGRPVNESTVRNMKKSYLSSPHKEQLKTEMPRSPRGRPTLLSQPIDELVQEYVRSLRKSGGVVNASIIIAGATGIVEHKERSLLKVNGGTLDLTKDWARSIMRRMGLSKRKGTKGVKTLPDDFETIKDAYVQRVRKTIEDHQIPDELVINWDQTGVNLVPCGNWTMDDKGM